MASYVVLVEDARVTIREAVIIRVHVGCMNEWCRLCALLRWTYYIWHDVLRLTAAVASVKNYRFWRFACADALWMPRKYLFLGIRFLCVLMTTANDQLTTHGDFLMVCQR